MRFFVVDGNNHKIYVTFSKPIETRADIPYYFTIFCQDCKIDQNFSSNDVQIEADTNSAAGGAVVGGLIGVLGGPLGILIGGTIGRLFGANADSEEQNRIRRFEQSW